MRVAVLGAGFHATGAVIPAIREFSSRAALAAVCDLKPENLAKYQGEGVATFTDYGTMLRESAADAVYIAVTVEGHYAAAMAALEQGFHVICEKPLAATVEDCQSMVETATQAGRFLATVFENRYHPYNRKIREWIDEGLLGRIEAVHMQDFWDGHKSFGPLSERRGRFIEASGALDCGIHQLDLIRYFAGGEWEQVTALGAWFGEKFSNPPHISVLGRLSNGVLATLNSSFAYSAYIADKRPHNRGYTIVGTKGVVTLLADYDSASSAPVVKLVSESRDETFPFENVPHRRAIGILLDDFAQTIDSGVWASPTLATGHDGLMAQIAVDKALAAARASRWDSTE